MIEWVKSILMHEHPRCEMCGSFQAFAMPLPLCEDCLKQIPWIRSIQCPICGRPEACPDCNVRMSRHMSLQRSAVRYDTNMKQWLSRYKYAGEERLAELFAKMMAPAYGQLLDADEERWPACQNVPTVFTFVPADRERLASRGFNQSARLASILSHAARTPVLPLLRKVLSVDRQSQKNKYERMRSVQGVYALNDRAVTKLKSECSLAAKASSQRVKRLPSLIRIIIVDDVYTTGSTMNECARLLKAAIPCRVLGLTWARS